MSTSIVSSTRSVRPRGFTSAKPSGSARVSGPGVSLAARTTRRWKHDVPALGGSAVHFNHQRSYRSVPRHGALELSASVRKVIGALLQRLYPGEHVSGSVLNAQ